MPASPPLEHVADKPCGHKDGGGGALSLFASVPLGLPLLSSAPAMAMVVLVGDSPRLWGHRRLDLGTPYPDMASNGGLEALPGRSARGDFLAGFAPVGLPAGAGRGGRPCAAAGALQFVGARRASLLPRWCGQTHTGRPDPRWPLNFDVWVFLGLINF